MRCHGNTGISHPKVLCTLGSAYVNNTDMSHMRNLDLARVAAQPRVLQEETSYDIGYLQCKVTDEYKTLNEQQRVVFDAVVSSVAQDSGHIFALNACGGSGKTYTLNLILAAVRAQKKVALATATSGIAVTLLDNGRTVHSRCKVPLQIGEDSTCHISKRDSTAALFRQAKLLIIDEVTMGHRHIYEAIDRTLRDIRENDYMFGGLTVVFRVRVVHHGSRPDIVVACVKKSYIWKYVCPLEMTKNVRAQKAGESSNAFAKFLLSVGDGSIGISQDVGPFKVALPENLLLDSKSLDDLCTFVFAQLEANYDNASWLCSRAIICPTNADVEEVNNLMIRQFPAEYTEYKSSDSVSENELQYPIECINSLTPSGLPP